MSQQILSITQINEYIRSIMDRDPLLSTVAIKGEISNYKVYPSGHHYFTLKDDSGALRCVMFKGNAIRLRFRPENGMKVIAMGRISVYTRDGVYQLYCTGIIMDGVGDLAAAYEQLKKRLESEGLFDPARKRPLPKTPMRVGIITSATGAASQLSWISVTTGIPYFSLTAARNSKPFFMPGPRRDAPLERLALSKEALKIY